MKEFAVDVAAFDILGDMSIIALGTFIANESPRELAVNRQLDLVPPETGINGDFGVGIKHVWNVILR